MKKLSLNQMEIIEGGSKCGDAGDKAIAVIGLVAGIGACVGPVGLLIAGPTAIGMGIFGVVCAFL
jgi:hypothetical protein